MSFKWLLPWGIPTNGSNAEYGELTPHVWFFCCSLYCYLCLVDGSLIHKVITPSSDRLLFYLINTKRYSQTTLSGTHIANTIYIIVTDKASAFTDHTEIKNGTISEREIWSVSVYAWSYSALTGLVFHELLGNVRIAWRPLIVLASPVCSALSGLPWRPSQHHLISSSWLSMRLSYST